MGEIFKRRTLGRRRTPDSSSFGMLFARFALTGLVAVLVIGAIGFILVRRSASATAVRDAKSLAALAGRGIVEPFLTPGVLRGDPAALARLDRAVQRRILHGTPIVRVKIWDTSGRIVYSDAHQIIGDRFPLGPDERRLLRTGGIEADASDLSRPENRSERSFNRLVEVYAGIRTPDGTPLLYEDYERSSTISDSSRRQWEGLLPALGGALLVLYLIQLPLAYSLAQRLRRKQLEREQLLQRAIEASDLERRRIAADLHDGAVQRLAGVSLSLGAATARNGGSMHGGDATLRTAVADAAVETRETIRELRTLLVDIYPPTLQRSGLAAALSDLVDPLRSSGVDVTIVVPEEAHLPDEHRALFYRVAQEAIRNARRHSEASRIRLELTDTPPAYRFSIDDDGRGFSLTGADADHDRQSTHFGMRLMRDLVDHAGGKLEVDSAPDRGTSITVTVPRQ